MRKLTLYLLITIVATQISTSVAQSAGKTEPQFTLTISEYHGEFGPALDRISVKQTNISNDVIYDPGCVEVRGWITFSVLYNGAPLEERDVVRRRHWEKHYSENCTSGGGVNGIKPGKSAEYLVSLAFKYDLTKPGTYDITATMESDPSHPEKSVTVKSNTLTVVVPAPGADASQ